MGLVISGAGASASRTLLEAIDDYDGPMNPNTSPTAIRAVWAQGPAPNTNANQSMFPGITGAGFGAINWDAAIGRNIGVWASQAGATAVASTGNDLFTVPFYQRGSLAAAIPAALLYSRRRYTVEYLIRVSVAGATEFAAAVGADNPSVVANNNPFAAWSYRGAVNGGRWTPRFRVSTAGAIVDGPDSGRASNVWRRLGIVYEEGPIPRLTWTIDGASILSRVGDAEMLNPIVGNFKLYPSKNMGAGVGTTVLVSSSRYLVEAL